MPTEIDLATCDAETLLEEIRAIEERYNWSAKNTISAAMRKRWPDHLKAERARYEGLRNYARMQGWLAYHANSTTKVYFYRERGTDIWKVGRSWNPPSRPKAGQTFNQHTLDLEYTIDCETAENSKDLEDALKVFLEPLRVSKGKKAPQELFMASDDFVKKLATVAHQGRLSGGANLSQYHPPQWPGDMILRVEKLP